MDCKNARELMPGLIDGLLSPGETRGLRTHMAECAGCRREHDLLRLVAVSVSGLPVPVPGRAFDDRVMAALGLAMAPRPMPHWQKALIAAGAGVALSWTGIVAYALGSRVSLIDALRLLQLAARPREVLTTTGMAAIKLGFAVSEILGTLLRIAGLALRSSSLPLQLGIASLAAFVLITWLSRRAELAR